MTKFKVGDKVRLKTLEDILEIPSYVHRKDIGVFGNSYIRLIEPEIKYCGQEFEIIDITNWGHQEFITIKKGGEVIKWVSEKMLEPLNNKSQTKTYLDKLKNKFKKLWK